MAHVHGDGHDAAGRPSITAFKHSLLMDAVQGIEGERVVINVDQNAPTVDDKVAGRPAMFYGEHDSRNRWVVMPVSSGLDALPETLGSNYGKAK